MSPVMLLMMLMTAPTNTHPSGDSLSGEHIRELQVIPVLGSSTDAIVSSRRIHAEHIRQAILLEAYGHHDFGYHRVAWVRNLTATIYSTFVFLGVISNFLVAYILLFVRRRALSNITNIFVLILALSDIVLCGSNMPVQLYYELKETIFLNSTICKLVFPLFGLPMHVSCLIMLLIACDRHQIIIYPLRPRMSNQVAVCLIVFVVMISVIISIPIAIYTTVSHAIPPSSSDANTTFSRERHTYCVERWPSDEARLIYSVVVFLSHFFIPLFLTSVLYGHIFFRLHERRFHRNSVERKRKTNKILIRIVLCFALCWGPWTCFSLWLEVHAYSIQKGSWRSTAKLPPPDVSKFENIKQLISNTMVYAPGTHEIPHPASLFDVYPNDIAGYSELLAAPAGASREPLGRQNVTGEYNSEFPIFGISSIEHTTRLIDLSLKLLAMGSGCINPWLYGWLNKFLVSLIRTHWKRMYRKMHLKAMLLELQDRVRGLNCPFALDECPVFETYSQDNPDSGIQTDGMRYRSKYHVCYCCGTYCACQIVLSKKLQFWTRPNQSLLNRRPCQPLSHSCLNKDSSQKDSVRNAEPCDKCAAILRSGSGSKTSHTNSSKQKGSRCSAEAIGMGPAFLTPQNAIECGLENPPNEVHPPMSQRDMDYYQFNVYKRFGRRHSTRFSGSSFSYLDPSTKQTSLLPSSAYTATPRGSLLRASEQSSTARMEMDIVPSTGYSSQLTKPAPGSYLCPPNAQLLMNPQKLMIQKETSSIIEEHVIPTTIHNVCVEQPSTSDEQDVENVITLMCPDPTTLRYSSGLATVKEQSPTLERRGVSEDNVEYSFLSSTAMPCTVPTAADNLNTFKYLEQQHTAQVYDDTSTQEPDHNAIARKHSGAFEIIQGNTSEIPFADEMENDEPVIDIGTLQMRSSLRKASDGGLSSDATVHRRAKTVRQHGEGKIMKGVDHDVPKVIPQLHIPTQQNGSMFSTDATRELRRTSEVNDTIPVKRRLSFYPAFLHRRKGSTSKSNLNPSLTAGRLSVRERRIDIPTITMNRASRSRLSKSLRPEPEHGCTSATYVSKEDVTDVDEFAHISRLVAIEAIRKKQARHRAMSVGSAAKPAPKRIETRSSMANI
ncbi:unnamed protein product [Dicrocoelium dendriticum]|nr:unnamed protein product [Dicrocoelium dendriticum]